MYQNASSQDDDGFILAIVFPPFVRAPLLEFGPLEECLQGLLVPTTNSDVLCRCQINDLASVVNLDRHLKRHILALID